MDYIRLIRGSVRLMGIAGRSGVRIPSWANDFSFSKRSGRLYGLGVVSWPGRKLITDYYLMKVHPLLPLCAFAAWTVYFFLQLAGCLEHGYEHAVFMEGR